MNKYGVDYEELAPGIRKMIELLSRNTKVVEISISDFCIHWVILNSGGKNIFLVERTYRNGTKLIVDPSDLDISRFREDPWAAWNDAGAK